MRPRRVAILLRSGAWIQGHYEGGADALTDEIANEPGSWWLGVGTVARQAWVRVDEVVYAVDGMVPK